MLKSKSQLLDELLVLQAQGGDRQAINILVQKWNKKLVYQSYIRTNNWEESQDIVQNVWQWLYHHLDKLDDVSNFASWIRTIVDRRSIDWVRKASTKKEVNKKSDGTIGFDHFDIVDDTDDVGNRQEESLNRLEKGLQRLNADMKLILTLYYLESSSIESISKILKIPKGTVKSRLFHAREKLKSYINNEYDER